MNDANTNQGVRRRDVSGLRTICKMYGSMTINGKEFVWDYATDAPVPKDQMPHGSDRHAQSERAKWSHCASQSIERKIFGTTQRNEK